MSITRKTWLLWSLFTCLLLFVVDLVWDLTFGDNDRTALGSLARLALDLLIFVIVGQIAYAITRGNRRG